MQKYILLIVTMLVFLACETGRRYDSNTTIKEKNQTSIINHDNIDILVDNDEIKIESDSYEDAYANDVHISNGLDVIRIREGRHEGYIRLVFDIENTTNTAKSVGNYDAKFNQMEKQISVILHDYKSFSALLPTFPSYSLIEQIYFEQYPLGHGFKFYIQLRENANVKIFDLKNPARLVFDIKAI